MAAVWRPVLPGFPGLARALPCGSCEAVSKGCRCLRPCLRSVSVWLFRGVTRPRGAKMRRATSAGGQAFDSAALGADARGTDESFV